MTENDDERSNAIDSAVLKNYIHILIVIFFLIWYFLVYLYKTQHLQLLVPSKKPEVMVN